MKKISITECPRDAMQGWSHFIPTQTKIDYINQLLSVGFDVVDFGSFVSPKAIPQMRDTADVLAGLHLNDNTKLLAIVANLRGVEDAIQFSEIDYLGFPLSLSETFQQKNTNKSIAEAFSLVEAIQNKIQSTNQKLVVYLSMGFGNPYGDVYNVDFVNDFIHKLNQWGVERIAIADTMGSADDKAIENVFSAVIPNYAQIQFSAHLHSTLESTPIKVQAALEAGCVHIETALGGYGGCPMADNELVGNLSTSIVIDVIEKYQYKHSINYKALLKAQNILNSVFK